MDSLGAACSQRLGRLSIKGPAVGYPHTMNDRKRPAFSCLEIIFLMGIQGEKDMTRPVSPDFLRNSGVQLRCVGKTQCTVYKVILVINDK